ncbi:MAG TPA: translocation/assembly module TamB domain-containing protein [Pyrinomonadaceae bacterium]|jgi:autotransporter translocation and assembly factor TamB|nr:translocation/assembly module TamB domain-containing protein [Pyrinomonadaceae bacterium]
MPADQHDEPPAQPTPELPDDATAPTPGEGRNADAARRRGWRRVVNRRNAMWTGLVAVVAIVALAFVLFVLYRSGRLDRIIAGQIIGTLAEYNIRAEIGSFTAQLGPRTVEIRDLKLYNAATGAQIGNISRIQATVRVEDMWALSLRRNVNLEDLKVEHPEIWVTYDAQGRSNFADLKVPPPDPNQRILFAYSTAHVEVTDAVVHYDDRRYDINGEARNVHAVVRPEDPNAPAASRANLVDLSLSGSTFTTAGHAVNPVDIELHARTNQTRADISDLTLRSPVAEAHMSGALDDWRALRYHMQVNAVVDLTETSDVLQLSTAMRGTGRFEGTVSGEGDQYKVEGSVASDALAADGVRLKALNVNATATGQGKSYEAQGKAVAELLTAGDFQLNLVQMVGGVTGTGTDFRWLGELHAAAARSGATGITGLILKDAVAEMRDGELSGSARDASASTVVAQGARVGGAQGAGVRFARTGDGKTSVKVASARAGSVVANGAALSGVQASGIDATINPDSSASVVVERVNVGGMQAAGVRTGSLNVAGVRLTVSSGGRVEGTTEDINAGTVAFTPPSAVKGGAEQQGRADNVRLARPRFTLEPGGRYRITADLSVGGGVLGTMNLGRARAGVVATNGQIQLNDFAADIFNGHAQGSAVIATSARASSSVSASFEGVDAGGLVALLSGNAVPLTGAATGKVNLSFPGTNFKAATGRLDATFSGATGRDESARTPLTGQLAVTAARGVFNVERADLRAGATELTATGRFSFQGGSDLAVNLNSTDASEFQSVLFSTGLVPSVEEKAKDFGIQLAGALHFNGTMTGDLGSPIVNGHFDLASLTAHERDLGSLSADIASNATETRINNGQLREAGGGGATFTAVIPRAGTDNISFDATLNGANAGGLVAALGLGGKTVSADSLAGLGPASGKISVTGFPGAMSGSADLRVAAGRIGSQPYDEIVARATFNGSTVNLENFDARIGAGHVTATGAVEIGKTGANGLPGVSVRDFRVQGAGVPVGLLAGLSGAANLPQLSGTVDFTATLSGNPLEPASLRAEVNAQGRDLSVNGQSAGQLTLVGHMTADQKFVVDLTTGLLGKPQVVHATVDLAGENMPATIETTLDGADLTPLFATLLNNPNVHVTGHATGTLRLSGALMNDEGAFSADALNGRAEFTELTVQVEDVPLTAENPLVVTFTPRQVTFERTRFTGPGTNITFGGQAAIAAGGTNDATINGDLNMRVLSNARQNFFLSGVAHIGVNLGGKFEAPQITGTASVANASLALLVSDERLTATEINGQVRFNANQASIETLTGRLGGGRFSVAGGALLAGFVPSQFRLTAHGENVTVPFPTDFHTTADADLEVRGSLESQIIAGKVNVRRAEYTQNIDLADIINRRAEAPITAGGGGTGLFGGTTTLDLTIQGEDALVVRNNLADVVGSVNLRVSGPMDDPTISGRIAATRGTLAFRNDRYDIQRAVIDLPPRPGADPVVNVQAQSDIKGYRVTVTMSGPLSGGLTTTATSDPPLPQADVISLITTGSLSGGPEGTSTLAQTGLGTATSLLTDTLINAPVQRATDKLFGLNRFEFDPLISGRGGQSPTARLTVGRQVNRNLAITYSTNVTGEPNQVIAVEYRVSDRLSFIAQYQQGSTDTLRSRSNNFSFELRFRKRY